MNPIKRLMMLLTFVFGCGQFRPDFLPFTTIVCPSPADSTKWRITKYVSSKYQVVPTKMKVYVYTKKKKLFRVFDSCKVGGEVQVNRKKMLDGEKNKEFVEKMVIW